jgi:hypothetical protein
MIDYGQIARPYTPSPMDIAMAQQARRHARVSSGLGAQFPGSVAAGLASSAASSAFRSVTIQSQITPDYTYDPNAPARPPSGFSEWVLKNLVRPTIVVQTAAGPVQFAPYGTPKVNLFPLLVIGTLAAMAGVGYLSLKGLVKK